MVLKLDRADGPSVSSPPEDLAEARIHSEPPTLSTPIEDKTITAELRRTGGISSAIVLGSMKEETCFAGLRPPKPRSRKLQASIVAKPETQRNAEPKEPQLASALDSLITENARTEVEKNKAKGDGLQGDEQQIEIPIEEGQTPDDAINSANLGESTQKQVDAARRAHRRGNHRAYRHERRADGREVITIDLEAGRAQRQQEALEAEKKQPGTLAAMLQEEADILRANDPSHPLLEKIDKLLERWYLKYQPEPLIAEKERDDAASPAMTEASDNRAKTLAAIAHAHELREDLRRELKDREGYNFEQLWRHERERQAALDPKPEDPGADEET